MNFGSPGAGTNGHLTGELFNLMTNAHDAYPVQGRGFYGDSEYSQ